MKMMLELIKNILEELSTRCSEYIKCCILFRGDGLIVQTIIPFIKEVDDRIIAAMTTSMLSSTARLCEELSIGEPSTILVDGTSGKVVVKHVKRMDDNDIYIGILTTARANLGLLLVELDRTVEKLRRVLE